MQWLNCADQNLSNFTTIVAYDIGAKERLDLNHYKDLMVS